MNVFKSHLFLSSFRCHIMSGWSWRQTGRKWHTWRIKWGRLWPRTWPSDPISLEMKFADSTKSELSQPIWDRREYTCTPTFTPRTKPHCRKALIFCQKKKNHIFILVPLATCGAFPVSIVTMSTRATESLIESLHLRVTCQKRTTRAICRILAKRLCLWIDSNNLIISVNVC